MLHIGEEQISAYLDKQLSEAEKIALEAHLGDCKSCRAIRDELIEISRLYREAERLEPSPFLWSRIAADFYKEQPAAHHWTRSLIAGLHKYSWNWGLASAALVILMIAGIVVFRANSGYIADKAALADIDRTYKTMAALDPDTYNPFTSGLPHELDANPFKSMRLSGEKSGIRPQPQSVD